MRWSDVWLCSKNGRLKAGSFKSWYYHSKYLSFSVLICDAKICSPKRKKAVWDNGPSLYADQMHVWLCTRDGRLKAGPLKGKYFHQKYLFFSLNLWCKDFVPPPKKKKKKKLFRTLDCLIRWWGVWLCTRDERLKAGPLRGWYCHPKYLFLSPDL